MAGSGKTVTYRELDDNSARLASALRALGLRPGDVIALVSDNSAEAFEIYWAALRSGLYITFVNWHLAPEEAAYILRDSGAQVVIASAGARAVAEPVVSLVPEVKQWYAFGGVVAGYQSYSGLLAAAGPRLTDQPRGSEMLYSSGTTGRPKEIKPRLHPGQVDEPGDPLISLLANVFDITEHDVYLSPAPIYHTAPLKWCASVQALGGTVVVMERFDAEEALAAIERFRVTVTQMVPTMFVRMLQLPDETRTAYDVSSLRLAVHAAAPCPPDVKDAMISWWGPILVEYYGATEQHGTTVITTSEWQTKRGSVGKAAMGVLHICDDDGHELPAGETGAIYFERDVAPFEYHNDPEKTASSRNDRGWSTLGDVGYLDDEGFLYLTDRKAFMIISGGVNIYPQEAENVLVSHPKVVDVAVFGVPNLDFGEEVKAVVQPVEMAEAGPDLEQELIAYCRSQLADVKCPRTIDFRPELPRHPTGKLYKRLLKDEYWAAHGESRII